MAQRTTSLLLLLLLLLLHECAAVRSALYDNKSSAVVHSSARHNLLTAVYSVPSHLSHIPADIFLSRNCGMFFVIFFATYARHDDSVNTYFFPPPAATNHASDSTTPLQRV